MDNKILRVNVMVSKSSRDGKELISFLKAAGIVNPLYKGIDVVDAMDVSGGNMKESDYAIVKISDVDFVKSFFEARRQLFVKGISVSLNTRNIHENAVKTICCLKHVDWEVDFIADDEDAEFTVGFQLKECAVVNVFEIFDIIETITL